MVCLSSTNGFRFRKILLSLQRISRSREWELLASYLCCSSPLMLTSEKQHVNKLPEHRSWQPLSRGTWLPLSHCPCHPCAYLNGIQITNAYYVLGTVHFTCLGLPSMSSHLFSTCPLFQREERIQDAKLMMMKYNAYNRLLTLE